VGTPLLYLQCLLMT